jgi:lipopolysaccharide/colanic/teichoic acid biosynthesis glycosyltransferase
MSSAYPSKRIFDLAVAGAACVAIAPVLVGLSAAIWLEDKGPPLFRQSRAGEGRKPFTILKFRSMHAIVAAACGAFRLKCSVEFVLPTN